MNNHRGKFKRLIQLVLCLVSIPLVASQVASLDNRNSLNGAYPDWFDVGPFSSLADDLNKARREGKQGVMVLFSTPECSYCSEFIRKSLSDPEISEVLQKNFHSVGMEIFTDISKTTDANGNVLYANEFAKKESAGYSPTIAFYGKDGKRILRLVGYQSPERFKKILDEITSIY